MKRKPQNSSSSLIAKCSQDLPYKFVERDGVFNADTQYATVMRKRFSFIGATGPDDTKMYYVALKFYKPIPRSVNMNLHFAVLAKIGFRVKKVLASARLATMHNFYFMQYMDQMKEGGWTENNDSQLFIFEDDSISLKIPENPPYDIVDGWKIIPQTTPLEV